MNFRPYAAALLITAGLAHAEGPAPVAVTVASAADVLLDPPGDGAAEHPGLRTAETALRGGMRAALSNLVCGAGALTGTGPGPWRAHAEILEWVSPDELRGAFGQRAPGIATRASLFDISRGEKIPLAFAEFPSPADRLNASKSLRVLPIEEAVRQIAGWITAEIAAASERSLSNNQGSTP